MDDDLTLGSCCGCAGTERVRAILMLSRRGPVPGTGWGCVQCDLPNDGAIAVMCDACIEKKVEPAFVVAGFIKANARVPIGTLLPEGTFDHDLSKHPEIMESAHE